MTQDINKAKHKRAMDGLAAVFALALAGICGSASVSIHNDCQHAVKNDAAIKADLKQTFVGVCATEQSDKQIDNQIKAGKTILATSIDTDSPSVQECATHRTAWSAASDERFLAINEGLFGTGAAAFLIIAGWGTMKAFRKQELLP